MINSFETIDKCVENIALETITLECGDVLGMGNLIKAIRKLEEETKELDYSDLMALTGSLKAYLETLIMDEADDLSPLEEGIEILQTMIRFLGNDREYNEDISSTLKKLGNRSDVKEIEEASEDEDTLLTSDEKVEQQPLPQNLDEEDKDILKDFIIEALDNLDSIEVNLIDLEQDPGDLDTINSIFRPFHTIKGVSGFLNLQGINKLSHSAENLLVIARDGEIRIDGAIVDIILDSVDLLKRMIDECRTCLEVGNYLEDTVDITALLSRIDDIISRKTEMGDKPIGEILVKKGAISSEDLENGLERQKDAPDRKIGELLVEDNVTNSGEVVSALREQKRFSKKQVELQVKVDTKKLDNLVDLTGELVIAQAMLRQNESIIADKNQKLQQNIGQLSQITSGLQKTAMSMRMVPIKNTFNKMIRLVRDLAKNMDKEVGLEMSGEDTEIDRNVVEELYEPMVHMIRNSVDHGIESLEERVNAGKAKKGKVFLKAYHRGGKIIIEITDDGRGLNRNGIIEKAKSKNLITDESKLTDAEINNLVFHPGFSTAKKVTDVSGRGVGMDVVKKAIDKLKGKVEITSMEGRGSTFIISLPLTLAIIEGMLVRIGKERYIIPALSILESFRPSEKQYSTVEGRGEMILLRESLIPLIRLDSILDVESDYTHPWDGLVVAVENEGERNGLLIDELLGKEEVVIKSLGEGLKDTKGVAGGAIMGDGRVGLILDMAGIFEVAANN